MQLLRWGGTGNDQLSYCFNGGESACGFEPHPMHRKLNETMWRSLLDFTKAASAKIIVGLAVPKWTGCEWNQQTDKSNCTLWNSTNARQLLSWTIANGYDGLIYALELGNEVDVQRVNRGAEGGAKVAQKESAAVRASGLDAPLLADASGGGASDDYVEDIGEGEEEEGEGTGAAYGAAFALYDISTSLGFVCGPLVAALFSTLHIEESAGPGGGRWKFFAILAPLAIVIALFAPLTSFIRR